ncbi:hypothetical protein Ancab_036095 [Ancistrocladus abbreviatus]
MGFNWANYSCTMPVLGCATVLYTSWEVVVILCNAYPMIVARAKIMFRNHICVCKICTLEQKVALRKLEGLCTLRVSSANSWFAIGSPVEAHESSCSKRVIFSIFVAMVARKFCAALLLEVEQQPTGNIAMPRGATPENRAEVDDIMLELDGTPNKSKFGASAMLGVSLSIPRAGAGTKRIPLYKHIQEISGTKELVMPVPAFNVINGGSHAGNNLAMQECLILPVGASSFREALRMGCQDSVDNTVYHILKGIIKAKCGQDASNVGDEGGFAPNVQDNREGLLLLMDEIEKAGYTCKLGVPDPVPSHSILLLVLFILQCSQA